MELTGTITYGSPMAGNLWRACWAWGISFAVTMLVSVLTSKKPESELEGLVYSLTPKAKGKEEVWYKKPVVLAIAALGLAVAINIVFF